MRLMFILFINSVALGQEYFNISLLDNLIDTTVIAGPENARYSDVWGFYYKEDKYAVLGSTEGSHFVKIENNILIEIDFQKGAFSGITVQHRDFKKYKNYIYGVCDEGESSLQVFDISYLPDSVHKVYDSSLPFTVCHNIFIDTLQGKLYACGPDNSGLKIFSLDNPESPELITNFTQVDYVHDCYVVNDTAFLNAGFEGLQVYYFGGENPQQIGVLDFYPDQGYNHSGWLSDNRQNYCFIDETEGKKVKLCRLENGIENISISELFGTKNALDYIPHNVMIFHDFAFVSYYNEGFRIFDLKTEPIKEVGFYDTFPLETDYKLNGAWGVFVFEESEQILISDRQFGLFLFEFPIKAFRMLEEEPLVFNTPFSNEESLILFNAETPDNYRFSLYSISGQLVYDKTTYASWINMPLNLTAGVYVYVIRNTNSEIVKKGKLVMQ